MTKYIVNTNDQLTQNAVAPVAVSNVDSEETGTISSNGGSIQIETTGKATVSIQITGTWSANVGGLYPQVTVNGSDWITISNPYSLLETVNLDYDSYIVSGHTGIWQAEVSGFKAFRLIASGSPFTGVANITLRASNESRSVLAEHAGIPMTRFLTIDGSGSGSNIANISANGNYSVTSQDFVYAVPAGHKYYLNTFNIQISDNANFNQIDYGAITNGVTNGVKLYISENGVEVPLLSGIAFKKNVDYFMMTPHILLTTFAGLSQTLSVDFTVDQDFGLPLVLDGDKAHKLIVRLNDDFSTLVSHSFMLTGRYV